MLQPENFSKYRKSHQKKNLEGIQLYLLYLRFSLEIIVFLWYTAYCTILFIFRSFVPPEPKSLSYEIILVTGGANGIGREICVQLGKLEQNLTIISWDVDTDANEILIKELKAHGVHKAYGFQVDVSNQRQVEATAQKIRNEIGNVTILFNNAGIGGPIGNAWEMDVQAVKKVYEVNAISHCTTLREFLPSMIDKGHGHVIETCSVFGFHYGHKGSPYIGSKHAVKGYIESIKEDVRHLPGKPDVKFSLIYPHNTLTNMTAKLNIQSRKYSFLVPHMTPAFVASKIIEGVRKNEEHIYIPGEMRAVAIILQILPPAAVRRLIDMADIQMDT